MLSDLAKKVSEYGAPMLSYILGTPLAGIALNLLARTFGVDATTPDSLLTRILRDPDAAAKLKELELKNSEVLETITLQKFKASTSDIQDARRVNLAYGQSISQQTTAIFIAIMPAILTIMLAAGIFISVWFIVIEPSEQADQHILSVVVGQLVLAFGYACKYWFGNSAD